MGYPTDEEFDKARTGSDLESNKPFNCYAFLRQFKLMAQAVQENSAAHGFWEDGVSRNKAEMIALMHSELSEALEAMRKDERQPDQHCPEFMNLEVELADTVIRIMDFAHGFGLDVAGAIIAKHEFNRQRPIKHGKKF